jgi:hypothetical protein
VGNSDNTPMVNIFSTTIAGATWHDVIIAALAGKTPVDFVKPEGIVTATVCVPSGLRAVPGKNCPTVTGTFAQEALDRQTDDWWGGQKLAAPLPLDARLARIPSEMGGWKRYLADEYARSYRGGSSPSSSQPQPAAPAPPEAPAPQPIAPAPEPPGQQNGRRGR